GGPWPRPRVTGLPSGFRTRPAGVCRRELRGVAACVLRARLLLRPGRHAAAAILVLLRRCRRVPSLRAELSWRLAAGAPDAALSRLLIHGYQTGNHERH